MPPSKPGTPAESAAARAVANGGTNARSNVPNRPGSGSPNQGGSSNGAAAKSAAAPAALRPQPASSGSPSSGPAPRPAGNSPRPASSPRPATQPRPGAGTPGSDSWNESSPARANGRLEPGGGQQNTLDEGRSGLEAETPRVARLTVASIDVWSALKVSFLLSVAAAIALVIAVSVLWLVLSAMGVFDALNDMLNTLGLDQESTSKFDIYDYVGFGKVISISIVLGAVNTLILTALSTVAVLLYNLSSGLVGGVRVTLSDD